MTSFSDALSETRNIWRGHLHDYQLAVDKLDGIGEAMTGMVEQQASMAVGPLTRSLWSFHLRSPP